MSSRTSRGRARVRLVSPTMRRFIERAERRSRVLEARNPQREPSESAGELVVRGQGGATGPDRRRE